MTAVLWIAVHSSGIIFALVAAVALVVVGIAIGVSITESAIAAARNDGFIEGRESERRDNRQEPVA